MKSMKNGLKMKLNKQMKFSNLIGGISMSNTSKEEMITQIMLSLKTIEDNNEECMKIHEENQKSLKEIDDALEALLA